MITLQSPIYTLRCSSLPYQGAHCEECGCTVPWHAISTTVETKAEAHVELSGWLEAIQKAARQGFKVPLDRARPFRATYEEAIRKEPAYRHLGRAVGTAKTRRLPRQARIPRAALEWSHEEVRVMLSRLDHVAGGHVLAVLGRLRPAEGWSTLGRSVEWLWPRLYPVARRRCARKSRPGGAISSLLGLFGQVIACQVGSSL